MAYAEGFYNAYLNRWLSPDTIVPDPKNPQSLNRYSYVNNRPLNRIDPSGNCDENVDHQTDECWMKYYEFTGKLGYEPYGLDAWGDDQLGSLLAWWTSGVRFTGNKWTAGNLGDAIDALSSVSAALGRKTMAALGLVRGGLLTFHKIASYRNWAHASQPDNQIDVELTSQGGTETNGYIHEMGHLIDWHIRLANAQWGWSIVSEQWLAAGGWWRSDRLNRWISSANGKSGAVSAYASERDPGEDFAETFLWYVNNQQNPSTRFMGYIRDPDPARQDALNVALGRIGTLWDYPY